VVGSGVVGMLVFARGEATVAMRSTR
jgi:hypothetical protein